jgi:hypothetical protein
MYFCKKYGCIVDEHHHSKVLLAIGEIFHDSENLARNRRQMSKISDLNPGTSAEIRRDPDYLF